MEKLGRPLKIEELGTVQTANLPPEVFNAVNGLIAAHWDGHQAVVRQEEIVNAIIYEWNQRSGPTTITRREIFDRHYLDFEAAYSQFGWHVYYDKPAYNENYAPNFQFKRA